MRIFLIAISIWWIIAGLFFMIQPEGMKRIQDKILKSKLIRLLGLAPLIIGFLLYRAADYSMLGWLLKLLGILAVLKGIFILFAPDKARNALAFWWMNTPGSFVRSFGVLAILLGAALLITIF